jgi:predicted HicB family RNase H-like nuclease
MTNTLQYKDYTASMEFDPEDQVIVGRVLGIDDIIAFHGKTEAEFLSNFHETVDAYLAASAVITKLPKKTSAKVIDLENPAWSKNTLGEPVPKRVVT